jgi:Flp pilus assembly protein, secretin CpaC
VIDVEVTLDTGNLQEKIRASTGSRGIRVGSSNGQIVLSGVAGNAVAAERAVQVAKSMVAEGGTIVNAMTVAPAQQVMLKVRFLEVERSASRELGVNWFGANNGGNRGFATGLGGVHSRAAGLPSRVLTQAEIRYPRPVRPPAAVQSAFQYLRLRQGSLAQRLSVLRWQILSARVPPLMYS